MKDEKKKDSKKSKETKKKPSIRVYGLSDIIF